VARNYVFTRFKTLNDISNVAVEGDIVSKLFKIYTIDIQTQVFVYRMNCIFMMLIAIGQMESKVGIPSL
jgi:hypothetical protein